MPSINISEDDFAAVAGAAVEAQMRGDDVEAKALDKIARKINAALSSATVSAISSMGRVTRKPRWQDMPSTLITSGTPKTWGEWEREQQKPDGDQ